MSPRSARARDPVSKKWELNPLCPKLLTMEGFVLKRVYAICTFSQYGIGSSLDIWESLLFSTPIVGFNILNFNY